MRKNSYAIFLGTRFHFPLDDYYLVGHLKTGIHRESLGETYFKETFYL
jgi:hypothetical protein